MIDLTYERHTSNGLWTVVYWYARLAPVLVAIPLIYLSQVNRLRAAGFVAVMGLILIALYPYYVASWWFNTHGLELGAVLWH